MYIPTLLAWTALRLLPAGILSLASALALSPNAAQAQPTAAVTLLHNFTGTGDFPTTQGQIKARDGNFYGVSNDGGNKNAGFVYKLTPAGTFSVLHTFENDGSVENDPLEGNSPLVIIQAADGNLYGICSAGGAENFTSGVGTFWKLTLTGVFTKLFDFDSSNPNAGAFPCAIIQGKDGSFYGLTRDGGKNGLNDGTYFRLSPDGKTRTELFAFQSGDGPGYTPGTQLLLASDGNFYGMTENGGTRGGASATGTIFRATTAGAVTKIYAFAGDGAPLGHEYPLIQAKDGFLYGVSNSGGSKGFGTIFRCSLAGAFTLLHDFQDPFVDGSSPFCSLVQAADGNFYGSVSQAFGPDPSSTNFGPGGYFQLKPGGLYTVIYKFPTTGTGPAQPFGNLSEVTPGVFFGTTGGGAAADGTLVKVQVTPTIISAPNAPANLSTPFNFHVLATNAPTAYGASGLPGGLTINATTGVISGTPTALGTFKAVVLARNAAGPGTAFLTITVRPAPPVITSAATATATTGVAFAYQITATNSPTSYSATGLPAGLAINASTGRIAGTTNATAGTYNVGLRAANAGGMASKNLTLTIKLGAPVINSPKTATATFGAAFSYQITAFSRPTHYSVTGLPPSLTLNTTTGLISGKGPAPGTHTMTLNAFNSVGQGSETLTLTSH